MAERTRGQTNADIIAPLESWHFWFVGRDALVRSVLARCTATDPALDIGCGTGAFITQLRATGTRIYGLDLKPMPSLAGAAVAGSAEALPFVDGSFGAVLARDVLEHVDDHRMLDEVHRVLRPDGTFIALVPAWPSLWSTRDTRAGHLRRYRRRDLVSLIRSHGFTVTEVRGYQMLLLPALAASRLRERVTGISVNAQEESPSPLLNRLLTRVNAIETAFARWPHPRPPHGSSLMIVARPHG